MFTQFYKKISSLVILNEIICRNQIRRRPKNKNNLVLGVSANFAVLFHSFNNDILSFSQRNLLFKQWND